MTASSKKIDWFKEHIQTLRYLTFLGGIIALSTVWFLHFSAILTLSLLGLLSLLYAYPFTKARKGLRDYPYLKIYLISITWAVTAAVPLLNGAYPSNVSTWWLTIAEKFCFVLAITIPFDIRDLKYDDSNKRTIPQIMGVKNAKIFSLLPLLIHFFVSIYLYNNTILLWAHTVMLVVTGFLLMNTSENNREDYFSLGLDGLPILQAILFFTAFYLV